MLAAPAAMTTHLLFEEDGSFKAGSALSSTDASHPGRTAQRQADQGQGGARAAAFREPAPAALIEQAATAEADIDVDFLWEAAPQSEFGFEDWRASTTGIRRLRWKRRLC
jgi:exoribonuclease II